MRVEKLRWGDEVPAELLPVLPFGHVLAAEVVYLAEAVQPLLSSMKALSGGGAPRAFAAPLSPAGARGAPLNPASAAGPATTILLYHRVREAAASSALWAALASPQWSKVFGVTRETDKAGCQLSAADGTELTCTDMAAIGDAGGGGDGEGIFQLRRVDVT